MYMKMMRIALFAALAGAGWQPASAAPLKPPVNLVANPSFEQAADGKEQAARGWSLYQCGYTRTRERSYAPDIGGPWSCRISGTGQADEKGMGGTNTAVADLPARGTFAATNSIYVDSCKQGSIYGAYVTCGYDDGTSKTYSFTLSDAQIKANLGKWKTYRLSFTSDADKKLKTITYWCLVWSKGEQKFIGTVYFDEVELRQIPTDGQAEAAVPFALASYAQTPPRVDGLMDDECWQRSSDLSPFLLSGGVEAAAEQTRARLAYDKDNLYLFLECYEAALNPVLQKRASFKADQTEHDSNVFRDDAVELFLQPSQAEGTYYHLAVNSRGALYDARCEASGVNDKSWDSGAKAAGKVGERSWTAEVAIPRKQLGAMEFTATEGWRLNLCRSEKPSGENSCWSPTGGPFHTPSRFGLVAFGPPAIGGGAVDLGPLRKGNNRLQVTVGNAAAEACTVTVTASVAQGNGASEVGRATVRLAPGKTETVDVEYDAPSGDGALRYEIAQDGRILLLSPSYPLQSDNPFIAWVNVLDKPSSHVITSFSVAQGETLAVPLVLLAGIEEEQFREATVTLEVPGFLRLVSPLSGPRRCPTPLLVKEEAIEREGQPYRRVMLDFGPKSVTFARAREERMYVENPLLFRAEYVGQPQQTTFPLTYEVYLNGQSRASGSVPLSLLPPLSRKSPRDVVVCNWPCGSTYFNAFLNRLSETEQEAVLDSWIHTGFNLYTHFGLAKQRGLKTAQGLPATLQDLCGSATGLSDYLRANPQYQDATLDGKPLPTSISPAHLLEEGCPARAMIKEYVGKQARQQPVLSWDYEVPVAYPQSIGFGAHNLAAFRKFAKIPDSVELTPAVAVRDYRAQWIDFRCRQNAGVVKLLQEGIKAANPACMFFVYSGYKGEHTRESYGIIWEYVSPHLDQGWCGYGRPVEQTRDTLKALGGKPLVNGELVWLGDGNSYPLDDTEINLMRRLTDCAGGVMVYYDWFVDGRFYSGLSRTAAVAADFEPFFLKGRRDDALATVEAGGEGNVVVYFLGAERLVFLFGTAAGPQQFRVQLKDLPAGAVALDYWTKKPLPLSPALVADVPAHGVKVIHVRPSANMAAPVAPRLVSPVDETVSDRRPLLVWDQAGGGDCRYRVEISPDRAFAPASTIAADLAANTHVITEPLDDNGAYFWRVRAVDAHNGQQSAWSPVGQFRVGVLAVAVQPSVFSPNGDGVYDTVSLQAELRTEAPWTVTVSDAAGRKVRAFSGKSTQPAAIWDGNNAAGKPAPDGNYKLLLEVKGKQVAAETVEPNPRFGLPNPELERWCFWRPQALEGGATEQDYHVFAAKLPYSLKLTGDGPEAKAYWSNYRSGTEIPITAGKTYTYSGLVKTALAADAQATIGLHFFTKDDRWAAIPGLEAEWEGIVAAATGKQDWKRLTVSCQAPENAAKAVLF
ncbi:MAG: sugar-binding protein, partial [Armatimonadia bacterium]